MTDYACLGVLVMTDGTRNPSAITQANVDDLVAAITGAFPNAHITWHLDNGALDDSTGSWGWLRTYIAGRIVSNGDAASYWRTFGFPGLNAAGEQGEIDTYLPTVIALGGPPLISGWYIPIETLTYAQSAYGVQTAVAQVWAQHGVDSYSGDGSPNCPYYPSTRHTLVPAQAEANRLDVVVLDALSADLFAAASGSRTTIDPADAGTLTRMEQITGAYLDAANKPDDRFRLLNSHVQIDYLYTAANAATLTRYKDWLTWLAANYAALSPVTIAGAGAAWRALHPVNDFAIAQMQFDPGGTGNRIFWLHTAKQRAAVQVSSGVSSLLDLTRYDDTLTAPATPSLTPELTSKVNQRDSFHPLNPYSVAAYREVAGIFRTFGLQQPSGPLG